MKIKSNSDYIPAPQGLFESVCVDVEDLGMVDGMYGPKHKLRVIWELSEKMADGRPFTVSQRYTASLHKQSTLFSHLTSWRGRPFTKDEMREFEMDNVIGASCQLLVKHTDRDGIIYANVTDVLPAKAPIKASGKHVRMKDRPGYKAPVMEESTSQTDSGPDLENDSIPF